MIRVYSGVSFAFAITSGKWREALACENSLDGKLEARPTMIHLTLSELAMKQLEKIVQELESGDMPLEKAIKKFEEGIKISKFCSEKLDESEKKITLLMRDSAGGKVSEVPFSTEGGTSDEYDKE